MEPGERRLTRRLMRRISHRPARMKTAAGNGGDLESLGVHGDGRLKRESTLLERLVELRQMELALGFGEHAVTVEDQRRHGSVNATGSTSAAAI